MALACRLLPESATWAVDQGAVLMGNMAGGTAAGMGGALLVSTLGRCNHAGQPLLPLSSWRLALRDAAAHDNYAAGGGGAVAVRGPSGPDASGWPLRHVAVSVERSSVVGNSAQRAVGTTSEGWSSMGGALLLWASHDRAAILTAGSPRVNNTPAPGAAALVGSAAACSLSVEQGSVIRGNTAGSHGGAVALGGCSLQAEAAQFTENTAGSGGGAVAALSSSEASLPNLRLSLPEPVLQDGTLSGEWSGYRYSTHGHDWRLASYGTFGWPVECVLACV